MVMSVTMAITPAYVEPLYDHDSGKLHSPPRLLSYSHSMVSNRPSMISDRPSMLATQSSVEDCLDTERLSMTENGMKDSDEDSGQSTNSVGDEGNDEKPNTTYELQPKGKRGKRKKYQKYTPEDRFAIGKYCFEHGPAAARKAFQDRYPEMSESVTRGFRDKYKLIIGESAVYEFEQQRQRDYQRRTGPLPRGRPRKYKPLEEDEMPASMISISVPQSLSIPNGQKVDKLRIRFLGEKTEHSTDENGNMPGYKRLSSEEQSKDTKKSDSPIHEVPVRVLTKSDKIKIGKRCALNGLPTAYKLYKNEYPSLTEDMMVQFHKLYLESEGASSNTEPQVFILEGEDHADPLTVRHSIASRANVHSSEGPIEYNEPYYKRALDEKERYHHEVAISRPRSPQEYKERSPKSNYSEHPVYIHRRSPVETHQRPVISKQHSTSVVASQVGAPIIHYPKLASALYHETGENHGKRSYSSSLETNGFANDTAFPYEKRKYEQSPPQSSVDSFTMRAKRFKYQKYSPEDRYNIGKLCNDIGLGATVKVYREQFPRLNESVVRTFRNKYRELIQRGNGVALTEAIERKPSRRSVSSSVEAEIVTQLKQFKSSKIEMTENLVLVVGENVINARDPRESVGMKTFLTKEWANLLLVKHKLVEKSVTNSNNVCCEKCQAILICPKCN